MTTALCFDLDGTLVHRTEPHETVTRATLDAHGFDVTDALVRIAEETFREAQRNLEPNPFERSMRTVIDETGRDGDPEAMVETLRERAYATTEVPDAARKSLDTLGEDDALGVITNGTRAWQVGKLEHHDLFDYFDAVVTSYEAGAHKPDPAPFDLLRERVSAEEYVMVGDDYEADVEGARTAGFVPIHYERDGDGPDLWATIDALL
ncbi:HAD family hydrolase [Haloarcula amylovorans]|uniref:HAD family hydrolase n=1 Tax=Haloarcula amylovorans TaxID=2562280 RepID=UPI0010760B02|nr:HAD family hydrolase [Halomicroarcula amylolytica]